MKYLVKNKVTIIITSIFVISLTLLWNYTSSNIDKVIRVFGNSYISNLEPDSYNSKFNEINYKNIKILYTDNLKEAIPILKEYLNDSKYNCERIFNEVNTELTIKLDYDKDVFLSRFGTSADNISAYYIDSIKTIYIYIDNSSDILNNKNNLNKILTHEMSHYYFSNFLKENNILFNNVPVWINEGIADYISKRLDNLDYDYTEFIEFDKLSDSNDWVKIKSGKQYIQSYYSINKIVSMSNESVITNLLLELKDHNIDEAFKNITGQDFKAFENTLKKN